VIVVLAVLLTLTWLKKEITGSHLEDHACEGPHVGTGVVLSSDNHLWGTVLTRLNLSREVMVCPAAVAEIADFQFKVFAELWTTLLRPILFNLLLDLAWVKQLKFQIWDVQCFCQLIITFTNFTVLGFLKLVLDAHLL